MRDGNAIMKAVQKFHDFIGRACDMMSDQDIIDVSFVQKCNSGLQT